MLSVLQMVQQGINRPGAMERSDQWFDDKSIEWAVENSLITEFCNDMATLIPCQYKLTALEKQHILNEIENQEIEHGLIEHSLEEN